MQRGTIEERNMSDYIAAGVHCPDFNTVVFQDIPYMQYLLHSRALELLVLQFASLTTQTG